MISLCGHEPSQNTTYLGRGKFNIFTSLQDLYHKSVSLQVYNIIQSFTKIEVKINTVYVSIYRSTLTLRLIALHCGMQVLQYNIVFMRGNEKLHLIKTQSCYNHRH